MAENLASIEPWMYRPSSVADSWLADYIARDAETLTKALQKSLSNDVDAAISPLFNLVRTDAAVSPALPATPTVSSLSGSDQDSQQPKRNRVSGGRVSKRKSRASKRSQTTFITADPANFRQMVQQITGARFTGSLPAPMAPVVRPEPLRAAGGAGGRITVGAGCLLPTLDTSAFLLDHHHQNNAAVGPDSAGDGPGLSGPGPVSFGQLMDDAASFDFESFSSFPTLESWKVM